MIPDLPSISIYGVPWMLLGVCVVFIWRKYKAPNSEVVLFFNACWAVVGYLFATFLPSIEGFMPWLPDFLPHLMIAVMIFGSVLGFQPGETFYKLLGRFRK